MGVHEFRDEYRCVKGKKSSNQFSLDTFKNLILHPITSFRNLKKTLKYGESAFNYAVNMAFSVSNTK